jgi:membrane complex biogenesis BtpA family protein
VSLLPPRENPLEAIFDRRQVLIGTVHNLALPGSPRHNGQPVKEIYDFAAREAEAYVRGGFGGIVLENSWDLPFVKPGDLGVETAATMAVLAEKVASVVDVPVGINVLANGVVCATAVAHAAGARFVRANQWVNAYIANEGFVEGAAAAATRFRSRIGAHDVRFFADVHVKHGSHAIVGDRTVSEQARDAEFFDADVLIATGQRTGNATTVAEIREIREGTTLPVIIGSGLTAENAPELLSVADGAIVGSSVKEDGVWWKPVCVDRVRRLTAIAEAIW